MARKLLSKVFLAKKFSTRKWNFRNDAKIRRRENDYFCENEILEPFMKIHETSFLD